MKDISIVLPVRAGSQRVVNKNTRPFHTNGMSLFQYKLAQVLELKDSVKEIIVTTNDTKIIAQIPNEVFEIPNFYLVRRPDNLGDSSTKVVDLIDHIEQVTTGSVIFWIHVTAPFIDAKDYRAAILQYEKATNEKKADSLLSANKIQQFIWDDEDRKIINVDRSINPWPNTQDLSPLFEINHGFYISSRKNYKQFKDRIGLSPALYICEGLKKIDIDWQEDFIIAQQLIQCFENNNA